MKSAGFSGLLFLGTFSLRPGVTHFSEIFHARFPKRLLPTFVFGSNDDQGKEEEEKKQKNTEIQRTQATSTHLHGAFTCFLGLGEKKGFSIWEKKNEKRF